MLRDAVARCLADTCPLDHVRECAERDNPLSDKVLRAVQDLGIPGMLVPEEHGGLGMTLLDAAIVAEQLAYAVAPVPFLASHVLAPIALSEAGSEEQKAHWLPKIASGEARIGVAISETIEVRDGAGVSSAAGKLNGTALFAIDFEGADAFIVADSGGRLHLVGAKASGLKAIALTTIDRTRCVGELRFDGAEAEPLADDRGATVARLRAAGRVILAADSLGAGQAMIEKAVDYAGQREQFGRLIGSFQAVKHMCAEMAARHEPCRSLVWYAAHA
ncbi:MAG TPA: acyl-CoA dehydrogenase family protein, partial [Hyphomonas sp.]|nr:acyl-CoA dehydrogenase family protein [Hyphomonas sp.]